MTTITIRHVPDDVRDELAARAARSGRSLQEYMLAEVIRLSSKPTVADLVDEIRARKQRSGVLLSTEQILDDRDADRR